MADASASVGGASEVACGGVVVVVVGGGVVAVTRVQGRVQVAMRDHLALCRLK